MRIFLADIFASVLFFTLAAMATELFIAGLTVAQSIDARIVAVPLMVLLARPFGIYRDWIFGTFQIDAGISTLVADTGAFVSFQLPIYAATLFYVGATFHQIILACGATVIIMVAVARPFGMFLDFIRRLFRVSKPT
jgi:hypothetical protein